MRRNNSLQEGALVQYVLLLVFVIVMITLFLSIPSPQKLISPADALAPELTPAATCTIQEPYSQERGSTCQ